MDKETWESGAWPLEDARFLWGLILKFAEAAEECGAEGNSGEFHDPRFAAEAHDQLMSASGALVDQFVKLTGFRPTAKPGNNGDYGVVEMDYWEFKR